VLSVEGRSALELVLGAIEEGGAKVEVDVSAFFVLATRDGLRCILLSRILFCCTGKGQGHRVSAHRKQQWTAKVRNG
jgi:hypothetical protein